MDGTEGVRAGETCGVERTSQTWGRGRRQAEPESGWEGRLNGEADGPEDGSPGTRRGKTGGSGNQEVHPHWVPGHTGTGKGV